MRHFLEACGHSLCRAAGSFSLTLIALTLTAPTSAQEVTALRVGTIHPGDGPAIANGVILFRNGEITAMGPAAQIEIPAGAAVLDHPDAHAYPGLIDALSAVYQGGTGQRGTDAGMRLADDLNPYDPRARWLLEGGVTGAYVADQGKGPWRGIGTVVQPTAAGPLPLEAGAEAGLGLRMTSGLGDRTHPLARQKQFIPITKAFAALAAYEKTFTDHETKLEEYEKKFAEYLEYHEKKKAEKDGEAKEGAEAGEGPRRGRGRPRPGGGPRGNRPRGNRTPPAEQGTPPKPADEEQKKPNTEQKPAEGESEAKAEEKKAEEKAPTRPKYPKAPRRDPAKDALIAVRDGELPLRVEARHLDEIRAALDLATEQEIRGLVLEHADAAASLAAEIAAAGVPVILTRAQPVDPEQAFGSNPDHPLPAALEQAGVAVAFASGTQPSHARHLSLLAAQAVGLGMSEEAALRALTLTPAEILGVADRVGSLTVGKHADILICSQPLLASDSRVLRVLVRGNTQYEAR